MWGYSKIQWENKIAKAYSVGLLVMQMHLLNLLNSEN